MSREMVIEGVEPNDGVGVSDDIRELQEVRCICKGLACGGFLGVVWGVIGGNLAIGATLGMSVGILFGNFVNRIMMKKISK